MNKNYEISISSVHSNEKSNSGDNERKGPSGMKRHENNWYKLKLKATDR